jgi:A/G-specific adenine glycosylase
MSPEILPSGSEAVAELRRRLGAWYRAHRRRLPWRDSRDPYRIWLSEVMLQQTRVASALPYYRSFLARFPTLKALARASEGEVLAAWAGLGYYGRARRLLAAAREVVREHAGRVPDDPDRFGRLPGVGRYTQGAVLSIAYGRRLPVVDGNVARVLARLFLLRASLRDADGARRLWQLAASILPMRDPGDWNQALMELGATVCLPRSPRCAACPVAVLCRARSTGEVDSVPPAARRRAPVRVRRAVALVVRRGRMLVARRSGAVLDGLWEPPGVELYGAAPAGPALERELRRLGVRARLEPAGHVIRHSITHRDIEVEVWRARAGRRRAAPAAARGAARWVDPAAPGVAFSALARRAAALCRDGAADAGAPSARGWGGRRGGARR